MKLQVTNNVGVDEVVVAGRPVRDLYPQLSAALSDDPELASFFAEPFHEAGDSETQWNYFGDGEHLGALNAQPDAVKQSVGQRLSSITQRLEARVATARTSGETSVLLLAETIDAAMKIAEEESIQVVGAQPVLVGWGRVQSGDGANDHVLRDAVAQYGLPVVPPQDPVLGSESGEPQRPHDPDYDTLTPQNGTDPQDICAASSGTARAYPTWTAWLMWFLVGLTLFFLLWHYLANCAIWRTSSNTWIANYCSAPVSSQNSDLSLYQERLFQLEREYLLRQSQCTAPKMPIEPVLPSDVTPEEVPREPVTDAERRVDEAGGALGNVNVILTWNTTDDLDLYIECPGGVERIYYGNANACGGTHDVDANRSSNSATDHGVENIVFAERPPAGTYRVLVDLHALRDESRQTTPFMVEVVMERDGQREVLHSVEGQARKTVEPFLEFQMPTE